MHIFLYVMATQLVYWLAQILKIKILSSQCFHNAEYANCFQWLLDQNDIRLQDYKQGSQSK